MFVVKGWSVDAASLKPQTEVFRPAKSKDEDGKKASKKRKRSHGHEARQDPNIRPDDVGRLWEQHVEGGELSHNQKKRERKKQKLERLKQDHINSPDLSRAAGKPKSQGKDIERWEDIVLGTRAEKLGKKKHKKKEKNNHHLENGDTQDAHKDIRQPKADIESPNASVDPNAAVAKVTKKKDRNIALQHPVLPPISNLTPMQSAMRQKLISARFRHLNETLYTEPSEKAQALFDQNPEMFQDYHAGFRQQVSVWPENPLDKFIVAIRERGKIKPVPQFKPKKRKVNASVKHPPKDLGLALPRTHGTCVIADLGCGDARLAYTLTVSGDTTALKLKLHSYDLDDTSPYVTKADIANLPLKEGSVDVAILCLSLMGTNWISFVEEAHRVLQWNGELWIAEIKSRFGRVSRSGKPVEHSVGGKRKQAEAKKVQEVKAKEQEEMNEQEVLQTEVDGVQSSKEETDVSAFVQVLKRRGFIVKPPTDKHINLNNKMFVKMEFVKALIPIKGKGKSDENGVSKNDSKFKFFTAEDMEADTDDEAKVLKPCLYKLR